MGNIKKFDLFCRGVSELRIRQVLQGALSRQYTGASTVWEMS